VEALGELFQGLERLPAALVIVQHMPDFMNEALVSELRPRTRMEVRLAQDGDILEEGRVYLAPAGRHLKLEGNARARVFDGEKVNFVRPCADVAMLSLSRLPGQQLIGVVLSGMGKDGAQGLRHIRRLGGRTFAQDRATAKVYGMPKAALAAGGAQITGSPADIRRHLVWRALHCASTAGGGKAALDEGEEIS